MEIFNIGPLELLLIVTIALIVLGPEEMVRTGRKLAKSIRKIIKSPIWKSLVDTSQEIRELPKKFIKEAELDETVEELNKMNKQIREAVKTNPLDFSPETAETKAKPENKTTQPDDAKGDQSSSANQVVKQSVTPEAAPENNQPETEQQETPLENSPKA